MFSALLGNKMKKELIVKIPTWKDKHTVCSTQVSDGAGKMCYLCCAKAEFFIIYGSGCRDRGKHLTHQGPEIRGPRQRGGVICRTQPVWRALSSSQKGLWRKLGPLGHECPTQVPTRDPGSRCPKPGPLCKCLAVGPMSHLGLEAGSIALAKKFIWVVCNILWKNPNELLGQPNTSLPPQGVLEWFLSVSSLDPIFPKSTLKSPF